MIRRIINCLVYSISNFSFIEEMSFYAVSKGRKVGIYPTWSECEVHTKGYPGAKFKKFSSQEEAEAFIGTYKGPEILPVLPTSSTKPSKVYDTLPKPKPNTFVVEKYENGHSSKTTSNSTSSSSYYAVAKGKTVGIYTNWNDCKAQVDDYKYAKYRKFATLDEATNFIQENQTTQGVNKFQKTTQSSKPLLNNLPVASDKEISTRHLSSVAFRDNQFQQDENGYVHCYTDGSCESNGRVGAKAGVGVWFGIDHPLNVSEPVNGPPTNNVAEIQAATRAIQVAQNCGISKLQINTDSQFLIKCITQWMPKWKKNGWKLSTGGDVKNKEQLEELQSVLNRNIDIKWNYVKAHKGIEGNEHADMLAKAGAANYKDQKSFDKSQSGSVRYKPY